jgi:hypothetical protein
LPPIPAPNSDAAIEKPIVDDTTKPQAVPSQEAGGTIEPLDTRHTVAVHPATVQQLNPQTLTRSHLTAKPGKVKLITRPSTFRLAVELQDALKAVADYNQLNMTDIVSEAIWLHLKNFTWPPNREELRDKYNALF